MSDPNADDLHKELEVLKQEIDTAERHVRNGDQDGHVFPKKDESTDETPPPA
jgi:hypothetical protein